MMEARILMSVEFLSTRLSGSTTMRRGLPKVSMVNGELVPTTSMRFSSVLPSVSIFNSTGMRNRSRSWLICPTTRKPLLLPEPVNRVFRLEFGRSRGIEPLGEEPGQLVAVILLGESSKVVERR